VYLIRLSALVAPLTLFSLQAQAQISGTCSNASLNGTYYYMFGGSVKGGSTPTSTVSYDELGKLAMDGNGNITSGSSTITTAGTISQSSFAGSYSVSPNCTGTGSWTANSQTTSFSFEIVSGGSLVLVQVTVADNVVDGRFYRAGNAAGLTCGNGVISGTYGALIQGSTYSGTTATRYGLIAQLVFDGNGGLTLTGTLNQGVAGGNPLSGTGTYSVASDCSGAAQITTASGTMNYSLARVEGGTVLMLETDANTLLAGSVNPQGIEQVLPQFAFGGGWYTALYFTNSNSTAVSFTVNFISDAGTTMTVPNVNGQVTLAPGATTILEALNQGPLTQGYATAVLPAGVSGYGIFRQSAAGRADQEASASFRSAQSSLSTLIYDDTNFTTAVAIVNTSGSPVTVNITAYDSNGNAVGASSFPLAAYAKTESALRGLLGLAGIAGLRGSADFSVTSGSLSVLGLRFAAASFTSIPVTEQ
jgi:hypothetical protein